MCSRAKCQALRIPIPTTKTVDVQSRPNKAATTSALNQLKEEDYMHGEKILDVPADKCTKALLKDEPR